MVLIVVQVVVMLVLVAGIASGDSYAFFVLFQLPVSVHNSMGKTKSWVIS